VAALIYIFGQFPVMSRQQAKTTIEKLVERFKEHQRDYHLVLYNLTEDEIKIIVDSGQYKPING